MRREQMRQEQDIVQAHDRLVAILLHDVPWPFEEPRNATMESSIKAACDVLCWVLKHDHNQTFANNIAAIDERLAEMGFVLGPLNQ
jgi:hypothetical protein